MQYISTRGKTEPVSGARAIVSGIAPDGGLYVPSSIPTLSYERIIQMQSLPYADLAAAVLSPYLPEYTDRELAEYTHQAYSIERFSHPDVCPLMDLGDKVHALELWHGPTAAFKDMALQILPHLLTAARSKCGEEKETVILVATSGDTGKAALEGFRDVPGTRVMVFFPEEGVSEIQRRQMITQEGKNVTVAAVTGNFDDAQTGVKKIFGDAEFLAQAHRWGYSLSSANSINWGRLVPQIAYYFSAYHQLLQKKAIRPGETVNVAVPTGNFGNILAAYYARAMGLPVHRLICAANANRILADFIQTGVYDTHRAFYKTSSPSMDILVSSNLERLLYQAAGKDPEPVRTWMSFLAENGRYHINGEPLQWIQSIFWADSAADGEARAATAEVFQETGYVLDPHTAVGYRVLQKYRRMEQDDRITILASTASPFKFGRSVARALGMEEKEDEMDLLYALAEKTGWSVPKHLLELSQKPVLHRTVCSPDDMKKAVQKFLQI